MLEGEFAENGVYLPSLDEYQARREVRFNHGELCISAFLGLVLSAFAFFSIRALASDVSENLLSLSLLLCVAIAPLGSAFSGFAAIAAEQNRIPASYNSRTPHNHITGLGAAVFFLVLLFVFAAGWMGQAFYDDFAIPEWVGQLAIVGITFVFVSLLTLSRLSSFGLFQNFFRTLRRKSSPLDPAGRMLSRIESWLVYIIAPTIGTTLRNPISRYTLIFGHIVVAAAFSWFAPSPIGLLGTGWGLVCVISITRRWSWIESDRRRLIEDPKTPQSELRVGTEEDLRDEAIISLLFLMLILPIGMRQFDLMFPSADIFMVSSGATNRLDAWTGFFGIELLKALPFIDWADTYQAHGATRITVNSALAMHAIVAARAIIDVVFLSALFQAVAISVSLAKNRRDFLAQKTGVDRLDDRIEKAELLNLAKWDGQRWEFSSDIGLFTHYNSERLSRLRLKAKKGSKIEAVVRRIFDLAGLEYSPPSEQLYDIAREKKIDRVALRAALNLVHAEQDYDVEMLAEARRTLNWRGGVEGERQRLVQMLLNDAQLSTEREEAISNILYGEEADSLLSVRALVINSLARNAERFPANIKVLQSAATYDRSEAIRRAVRVAMARYQLAAGQPKRKSRSPISRLFSRSR